jgi:hypothetical protein
MKSINDLIKIFDYSNAHGELLRQNLISELNNLPIITMKFHKGRAVYRCRKHDSTNEKERFYFESDISYRRDIQNIKSIGRCNYFNSSKFYGSITTEEVKKAGSSALFFETATTDPNTGDILTGMISKGTYPLTSSDPSSSNTLHTTCP